MAADKHSSTYIASQLVQGSTGTMVRPRIRLICRPVQHCHFTSGLVSNSNADKESNGLNN
jgi:hypothetical protein